MGKGQKVRGSCPNLQLSDHCAVGTSGATILPRVTKSQLVVACSCYQVGVVSTLQHQLMPLELAGPHNDDYRAAYKRRSSHLPAWHFSRCCKRLIIDVRCYLHFDICQRTVRQELVFGEPVALVELARMNEC